MANDGECKAAAESVAAATAGAAAEAATDAEIQAFVEANWEALLQDAERLIAIDSSEDIVHAAPGAPFGSGPRRALEEALAIAERMGLQTHDGEGYAGYADALGGSGQQVGVIGHVDVVPAGEGWDFPPFTLTRKEGMLVGRGTSDDKIPLLCALYGLKFWLDRGVRLRHTVRFIFGCNEESGMAEIPYYLAHHAAPDFLFTPDADFPLCYGEKGLFGATFTKQVAEDGVLAFEGGVATNAVPGIARAVVAAPACELPPCERIAVESYGEQGEQALVTATGIAGHASLPEGTVNAIGVLARYLLDAGVCGTEERAWMEFAVAMAESTDGAPAGVACADEDFGALTSVVGTMFKTDGEYSLTDDIRFPTATTGDALERAFTNLASQHGVYVEITRKQEPFRMSPDTPAARALLDAYCTETGKEVRPFTMGGATYAREFPNAVSFGPAEEGAFPKPAWVGGMHAANEGIAEDELKRALRIYIRAFGNLNAVEDVRA